MNTTRTLLVCIVAFVFLTKLFGGSREHISIAHDFSTPEGAILCLEDAYRAKDIEKAVRCKDFRGDAEQMLSSRPQEIRSDPAIVAQMAQVLERAYRVGRQKDGFPDMRGVSSTFGEKKSLGGDTLLVTEVFRLPDGSTQKEKVYVKHTTEGWRVMEPPVK